MNPSNLHSTPSTIQKMCDDIVRHILAFVQAQPMINNNHAFTAFKFTIPLGDDLEPVMMVNKRWKRVCFNLRFNKFTKCNDTCVFDLTQLKHVASFKIFAAKIRQTWIDSEHKQGMKLGFICFRPESGFSTFVQQVIARNFGELTQELTLEFSKIRSDEVFNIHTMVNASAFPKIEHLKVEHCRIPPNSLDTFFQTIPQTLRSLLVPCVPRISHSLLPEGITRFCVNMRLPKRESIVGSLIEKTAMIELLQRLQSLRWLNYYYSGEQKSENTFMCAGVLRGIGMYCRRLEVLCVLVHFEIDFEGTCSSLGAIIENCACLKYFMIRGVYPLTKRTAISRKLKPFIEVSPLLSRIDDRTGTSRFAWVVFVCS